MATTHTDTNVNQLIINKLTKQEYDNLQQVSDTELYLVEEQVDSTVTQGSTNPVQSGAVYEALQDIGGNINDGITTFTKNNQTIGTTSANQENDKTIAIPNDVEMVYFAHSKALSVQTTDAYYDTNYNYLVEEDPATWTDPNPQHRITTDGYYYDLSTGNIYQVDNYETIEATSNVTIQGDTNKLYCDVDTNKTYRWDGSNFVLLVTNIDNPTWTDEQGTYDNKPAAADNIQSGWTLSALFSRIKKWFASLKKVCFTGSYGDLNNAPTWDNTNKQLSIDATNDNSSIKLNSAPNGWSSIQFGDSNNNIMLAYSSSANVARFIYGNNHVDIPLSKTGSLACNTVEELTNISVTWMNDFLGSIHTYKYEKILQIYLTISAPHNVGINSRICNLDLTPTYSTYYTTGLLVSTNKDPLTVFTSSQGNKLTFYLAETYVSDDVYTGSIILLQ